MTIRTIEGRFALSPYACPGAWHVPEGAQLTYEERKAMADRGRACVERTDALTDEIAQTEHDEKHAPPEVPYDTFTDSIPNIIGCWLARAVEKFGIELYGFVWMGNHAHLLLQAPRDNFAEFMGYLNGQLAANINRFLGRKNQLWFRRYAAAPVLDEAAELDKLAYLLANPQNAGIAYDIEDWPGLSSGAFLFENRQQRFLCFNRTAWHMKGRPKDIGPFLSTVKLKHKLLPQLATLDEQKIRRTLRELIAQKLKPMTHSILHKEDAPPHLARRRLQARTAIPTERPVHLKRSPQPLCHTTKPSLYKLYREWYRRFRIAYKASARQYIHGNTSIEFPPGAFAPSKYPRARHSSGLNKPWLLYPTRSNLEIEDAHTAFAT